MKCVYILRKNDDPNTYIGFTNNSIKMHYAHQQSCYNANSSNYNHRVWEHIRENGGLKSWTHEILEKFSDEADDTLLREKAQHYIAKMKPTLNTYNFNFDPFEYKAKWGKERRAEYNAKWGKKNKERIAEYKAKWHKENKERIAEKKAEYYAKWAKENKEKIVAVQRQRRQYQKSWGGALQLDNCNLLRIDVSIFS